MIQEIELIKAAERDAVLRIETAKKKADYLVLQAREDAAMLLETRKNEADAEVKRIRENSLSHGRAMATDISEKTDRETAGIAAEGESRIPAAVNIIVKKATGGSDVLSGTNG